MLTFPLIKVRLVVSVSLTQLSEIMHVICMSRNLNSKHSIYLHLRDKFIVIT